MCAATSFSFALFHRFVSCQIQNLAPIIQVGEEHGKSIPFSALIHFTPPPIALQLTPLPRMASLVDSKLTTRIKTPSPTTVFDGPSLSPERGLLGAMVMSNVNKVGKQTVGRKRLFGSWSWRRKSKRSGKRDGLGGSFVFPSSVSASFGDGRECCSEYGVDSDCASEQVNVRKMTKSKSFQNLSQQKQIPQLWHGRGTR